MRGVASGTCGSGSFRFEFLALLAGRLLGELNLSIALYLGVNHADPLARRSLRTWHPGGIAERLLGLGVLVEVVQAHAQGDLRIVRVLQAAFANRRIRRFNALVVVRDSQVGIGEAQIKFTILRQPGRGL